MNIDELLIGIDEVDISSDREFSYSKIMDIVKNMKKIEHREYCAIATYNREIKKIKRSTYSNAHFINKDITIEEIKKIPIYEMAIGAYMINITSEDINNIAQIASSVKNEKVEVNIDFI